MFRTNPQKREQANNQGREYCNIIPNGLIKRISLALLASPRIFKDEMWWLHSLSLDPYLPNSRKSCPVVVLPVMQLRAERASAAAVQLWWAHKLDALQSSHFEVANWHTVQVSPNQKRPEVVRCSKQIFNTETKVISIATQWGRAC